jgi:hypothetical protein
VAGRVGRRDTAGPGLAGQISGIPTATGCSSSRDRTDSKGGTQPTHLSSEGGHRSCTVGPCRHDCLDVSLDARAAPTVAAGDAQHAGHLQVGPRGSEGKGAGQAGKQGGRRVSSVAGNHADGCSITRGWQMWQRSQKQAHANGTLLRERVFYAKLQALMKKGLQVRVAERMLWLAAVEAPWARRIVRRPTALHPASSAHSNGCQLATSQLSSLALQILHCMLQLAARRCTPASRFRECPKLAHHCDSSDAAAG